MVNNLAELGRGLRFKAGKIVADLQVLASKADLSLYQLLSGKGAANGYAGLGAGGYVPTAQLGSGAAGVGTFLRGDQSWAAAGGGSSATTVEVDLGSTAQHTGRFTITDAAIGATSKVLCWQAPGPYTGKGTRADEAALAPVNVIMVEPAAGSAVVTWSTPDVYVSFPVVGEAAGMVAFSGLSANRGQVSAFRRGRVRGNVKFSYLILS